MANTFELIASSTVGSGGTASIDFTSIPSTYTDLVLKLSARDTEVSVNNAGIIQFNGETATTNYTAKWLYGTGSSVGSLSRSGASGQFWFESDSANATANTFANIEFYIPNYAGATAKSVSVDTVTETNATTTDAILTAALWNNTAAITSIKLKPNSGLNFVQYSTAYLYGVKNA
jgi:hypothetical protein